MVPFRFRTEMGLCVNYFCVVIFMFLLDFYSFVHELSLELSLECFFFSFFGQLFKSLLFSLESEGLILISNV